MTPPIGYSLNPIQHKHDCLLVFEVINGNPNGDPDANAMARTDPDTGRGLVTDVANKASIRRAAHIMYGENDGYRMYIRNDSFLNAKDEEAVIANGAKNLDNAKIVRKNDPDFDKKCAEFMCRNYYDIRTFGAVMTGFTKSEMSTGGVRGPVQFTCGQTVDPIQQLELTITRQAVSTEKELIEKKKNNTMCSKFIVPYGLYVCPFHISAAQAQKTGFSEQDLAIFWESVKNMFEFNRSAMKGEINVRMVIDFEHDSMYGNAPAWQLFEALSIKRINPDEPARKFQDYDIQLDMSKIPAGVTVNHIV